MESAKKGLKRPYAYAKKTIVSIRRSGKKNSNLIFTNDNYQTVEKSGLFDAKYYLDTNKDVKNSGMNPLQHYMIYGGSEGRNPSKKFDAKYYLAKNAVVRESKQNPLLHYIQYGKENGLCALPPRHDKKKRSNHATASKRVDIINVNFYDWDGEIIFKGGAERYVFDLAKIIQKMGHKPRILQNANKPFTKVYRGVEVVGVVTGAKDAHSEGLRKMSAAFSNSCKSADLIVASPLDLASEINSNAVIGVNHGIHWDTKTKRLYNNRTSDYAEVFDGLSNIELGVCVDTNFINWTRTYDYELGKKLRYIPNYYDHNEFLDKQKDFDGRLRIMFPRRLYEARGITITLQAFEVLLDKYDDIDLLLVGQTTDESIKKDVNKLIKEYDERVSLEEYDMEDMHKAYEKSHIVLIPTLYAEGTSLSCLEAMATNNAVISTNIGGLPNLIVDHYNGLLIDPDTNALIEAVEALLSDRELTKSLAQKGLDIVKAFEKSNWDKKWTKILEEIL